MTFFVWRKSIAHSSRSRKRVKRTVDERAGTYVLGFLALILCQPHTAWTADDTDVFVFDIPQQTADQALIQLAEQADLTFVFPYDVASETTANAVVGRYTLQEAVSLLLENTGLRPLFDPEGGLKIEAGARSDVEETEMNDRKKSGLAALLSAVFLGSAAAQDVGGLDTMQIEEIVVTAQIRAENFQDVPVTGTVFAGDLLVENRFFEIDDIARFTPGFAASYFNNSSPNFAVRGAMNTFSQAGASKPVGIFIDDVYVPRYSGAAFQLFDVRQVSVLRGPQGTLFGRNVTGGAIQIYTEEPSFDAPDLRVRAGTGNYDLVEVDAFASGPFSDTAAGKISVGYRQRDGFSVDRFNGNTLEDLDSLTVRGGLTFHPAAGLEIRLAADYARDENGGKGYSFVSSSDGSDLTGNDGDNRTSELRVPQSFERDIYGASAHVDWTVGAGTVQSITALRQSDSRELYSLGAADVTLPSVSTQFIKDDNDEPSAFSQELRFISEPGKIFDFVAGLYFYDETTDRFLGDLLLGANGNAEFVNRDFTVQADTESFAAYLSATFHLGPKVDLGIGGRYTSEDKDVDVRYVDSNNNDNNFNTAVGNSFSEFTPRITLSYFPTDTVTLFASRTEGFTAGGFNTETSNITAVELGFEPETITAYELGAKTAWNNGRLIANATLFRQEYENKQEGFLLPGSFFSIFNAAEATMEGAELELAWSITSTLSATATYSWLDAVYDEFVIPGGADFSGNQLQTAPENSFSATLDYVRDIGTGSLRAGINYTWQDEYFTGASNIPQFLIDSYSLIDARLGYSWNADRWSVTLWGRNLGDEDFVRIRGTSGAIAEYFGPPRTYGINVTFRQ